MFHLSLHKIHKYKMPDNANKGQKWWLITRHEKRQEIPRPRSRMRTQSKRRMTAMKIATGIFPDVSLLTLLLALQTGALWKISLLNYKACHVQARAREKRREESTPAKSVAQKNTAADENQQR